MNRIGIAAGALACAVTTSAFAQSPPPSNQTNPPPEAATPAPGETATPTPAPGETATPTPTEAARETGDMFQRPIRAPSQAFELGVEAGYTQGFGVRSADPRLNAGPGGAIGVRLDDRINPRWSVGLGGQLQAYGSSGTQANPSMLRGVTADLHGTYHFSPYRRLDPYLGFGAGYRLFTETPRGNSPTLLTHALELGNLKLGLDLRASESVAISPVIGADLDLFVWRSGGGNAGIARLPTMPLRTFIFAGVEGRFDLGGQRVREPARAAAER